MKHWFKFIVLLTFVGIIVISACNSSKSVTKITKLDPITGGELYMGIYANIIQPNCALPACHDGSFEPNFTTPQSTYYTTVMHDVYKNSFDKTWEYRIVPGDTAKSILYERITNCCFIDKNDRMPVLMEPLSQVQIDSIAFWIMSGAPNWNGEFTYEKLLVTSSTN